MPYFKCDACENKHPYFLIKDGLCAECRLLNNFGMKVEVVGGLKTKTPKNRTLH